MLALNLAREQDDANEDVDDGGGDDDHGIGGGDDHGAGADNDDDVNGDGDDNYDYDDTWSGNGELDRWFQFSASSRKSSLFLI